MHRGTNPRVLGALRGVATPQEQKQGLGRLPIWRRSRQCLQRVCFPAKELCEDETRELEQEEEQESFESSKCSPYRVPMSPR